MTLQLPVSTETAAIYKMVVGGGDLVEVLITKRDDGSYHADAGDFDFARSTAEAMHQHLERRKAEFVRWTFKYNPNHDELGRFASGDSGGGGDTSISTGISGAMPIAGGGGPAMHSLAQTIQAPSPSNYKVSSEGRLEGYTPPTSVNSASELFQRTYDPSFTAQHAIDTTGSQYRVAEAEAKLALAGSQDTKAQFTGSDGKYVPERQAIHDDLLNRTFTDANIIAAIPKDGEQKTFYVLGGRGGSGKSWFSNSPDAPFDASKTITINTDDYKAELPEFEGWNAALVHEESSDIAERAHDIARDRGLNVTFDATLKSPDTITRLVNGYEKAGYRIEGYFMHTAPQVSAVRALNRFNKPNPGQALSRKNRYVPPSYVLKSVNNEKVFDSLTPRFAKYGIYDNNSGNGPKLVKSGGHN